MQTVTRTPRSNRNPLRLRRVTVPEHTVVAKELGRQDEDPLAIDPLELERFITRVMKRVGRDAVDLKRLGFYLQVDPLVLLLNGHTDGVRRTACVPVRDDTTSTDAEDVLTFPPAYALEVALPDGVALNVALPSALDAARRWALADDSRRLGGFVRLHVVPDRKAPDGARTALCIECLPDDVD
ncbi:MAG: hypothetical protein RMA76_18010 [Deltaproteobacteria bacterium]|jgi:hypothetical protein